MQLQTIDDVLKEQLADLYDAERQLVEALPKMASAASDATLREAFEHHLDQTQEHVRRLEQVFDEVGSPQPEHCEGMEGLIEEGEQVIHADADPAARDAALIAAAQRVEHYEIAAYGTARTLADQAGHGEAKSLLDRTLDEESEADKLLTKIARGGIFKDGVNERAAG